MIDVSATVAIPVALSPIRDPQTVVAGVPHAITVLINLGVVSPVGSVVIAVAALTTHAGVVISASRAVAIVENAIVVDVRIADIGVTHVEKTIIALGGVRDASHGREVDL